MNFAIPFMITDMLTGKQYRENLGRFYDVSILQHSYLQNTTATHNPRDYDALKAKTSVHTSFSRAHCSSPDDIIKHFVMTKIEKTGTSTLFSVFARFILLNTLNVLQSNKTIHINWSFNKSKFLLFHWFQE